MTTDAQEFQGMSDDDLESERSAQRLEHQAHIKLEEVASLLRDAAQLSELRREELLDYRAAIISTVADYHISSQSWNEAIAEARETEL